ncbi:NYN domain-containing protein [Mesorhizobium atlanticum]
MRTIVYVDGFNLYYRMLKDRPSLKWVNQLALAQNVLQPGHIITRVNYYIARVSARAHDPQAPARQATYLNALGTVPEIVIHEGTFMISEPWMPLANPPQSKPNGYNWTMPPPAVVKVVKSEEKGSDVDLGVHLVRDAFLDAFDVAVVITNDSDLVEPIRIAIHEAGKRVGLLVPVKYPNQSLMNAASFYLRIRPGHLRQSQFPATINLPGGGAITKPATWA